jgi:hypothetical protein
MIALLAVSALAADRFALVTAASDGGPGRPTLRHAQADAQRFAEVLTTLGGVDEDGLQLLIDPTVDEVRAALAGLADRARGRERSEIVAYFTGHADAGGLQFGAEALPYAELRSAVDAVEADIRVVIIDGCSSGAVLRTKGGTHADPLDVSPRLDGIAFLTSSAADEASQESDVLGGSFFTHSLTTGLRGAADSSGDGRVSLAEAYRYAYASTLSLTERTLGGAQHASFDLALAGEGDVVLTELGMAGGQLVLPATLEGVVTVRRAGGDVLAEVAEGRVDDSVIAVTPGRYDLVVQDARGRIGGTLTVGDVPVTVDAAHLRPLPAPVDRVKGGRSPARAALLGAAIAGYAGAATSFAIYSSSGGRSSVDDDFAWERASIRTDKSLHAFYFTGSMAVVSTTTLVLLGGGR